MPEPHPLLDLADPDQRAERLHRFAHDLKNRLGSLWQAATLLRDAPAEADRALLVSMAEKSYFQGARALEELLDDFGVARGVPSVHPTPLDLVGLLQECIAAVAFRSEKKEQTVRLAGPPSLAISGDAALLRELFTALLSNASKFSAPGSTTEVRVQQVGRTVRVEVIDRGVGLTAEDLAHVFQRYAMLSSRSTNGESQARGTLGRAWQWAHAHGGTLKATSPGQGQGSTFIVELPVQA